MRWGQRLVHIEADDVHGSIDALRGMGDWPQDPAELSARAYVEHYKHSRRRDFTRAVIERHRRPGSARKNARCAGTTSPPRHSPSWNPTSRGWAH